MNTPKPYPIIDGHRKHYVRYPVLVTPEMAEQKPCALPLIPGKWIAVDVLHKGYSHLISPVHFDTFDQCQTSCEIHNRYHGWTIDEANAIITESMELCNFKKEISPAPGLKRAAALVLLLVSIFGFGQTSCDGLPQFIGYSTTCHTFCTNGTYNPNQNNCGWQRVSGQNCDSSSYVFVVNGGAPTHTPSIIFTPGAAGITTFTLTGWKIVNGDTCHQSVSWSFTTVACSNSATSVGIKELMQDHPQGEPRYFDLQGREIEKRYNELIIQQVGLQRRKVYFIN